MEVRAFFLGGNRAQHEDARDVTQVEAMLAKRGEDRRPEVEAAKPALVESVKLAIPCFGVARFIKGVALVPELTAQNGRPALDPKEYRLLDQPRVELRSNHVRDSSYSVI